MAARRDVDAYLERDDKWYLGGGDAVLWAPAFPVWLDHFGFWDSASFYNFDLEPCFTFHVVDEAFREVPFRQEKRSWRPSHLEVRYRSVARDEGLSVIERKAVLPWDVLAGVVEVYNRTDAPRTVHLVCWTCHPYAPEQRIGAVRDIAVEERAICFTKALQVGQSPMIDVACVLGAAERRESYLVQLAQPTANQPRWELTPFYDQFAKPRLANAVRLTGVERVGLVYIGQHYRLALPARGSGTVRLYLAMAEPASKARAKFERAAERSVDPIAVSRENWRRFFDSVPQFECSDPHLDRYYWYRWYGLRLLTTFGGAFNHRHPAVSEGISYFRGPIAYSAPAQMLETRWAHDPLVARGCILNFLDHQNPDGSFPGTVFQHAGEGWEFFHAHWGEGVRAVDAVHPSDEFLAAVYDGLSRYVAYFDRERDREGSGLYDVVDQYETGQEFMTRYLAVSATADVGVRQERLPLKGVDATVYVYEIKKALAEIARRLGKPDDEARWRNGAAKIKEAVLRHMWNAETGMFSDVDTRTMRRTDVKVAVCFLPYMTDIVDERHVPGLRQHLLNPSEFWTPYPVAATSVDDPNFNPDALWKGRRHKCPWNGRVWPMANSHVAEALASVAYRLDASIKPKAAEFIRAFVKMLFFDGDPERPNCFEHYHPFNGRPCVFRGIDDYQHSWIVDLIIKYVAGFQPQADGTYRVEPLPFGLDYVRLTDIPFRGKRIDVEVKGGQATVWGRPV